MNTPKQSTPAVEAEPDDQRILADALAREDAMDDAWMSGGCAGPPPRRDTCHPCGDWADHAHDPQTGARVDFTAAELAEATENAMTRGVFADMASDPDAAAWALYDRLQSLDRQQARQVAAGWVDRLAEPRRLEPDVEVGS